jgi:predicted ATPase
MADAAESRPVLCLIDDAQWIDHSSSQVLGFVARRLQAERLAMVFAVLDPDPAPDLHGLDVIKLRPLARRPARQLLEQNVPGVLIATSRIASSTRCMEIHSRSLSFPTA